nr:hypothetical protein F11G11.6 - Caenorhabditis elegans [Caenorhabditis elegans]
MTNVLAKFQSQKALNFLSAITFYVKNTVPGLDTTKKLKILKKKLSNFHQFFIFFLIKIIILTNREKHYRKSIKIPQQQKFEITVILSVCI